MTTPKPMNGLLPVRKRCGMVSKDVSRWFTRRFGKMRIGHVGTLDPMAEGVLPILLGKATRLQDYLLDFTKEYEFQVTFGFETTTGDREGEEINRVDASHVTETNLCEIAAGLVGERDMAPPMFSAIKVAGVPLYRYAREGKTLDCSLESLARHIVIESCELLRFAGGIADFKVRCSKGTYVRSLAKEIATQVGTCGTVTRLVRTEAAGISINQTVELEELEAYPSVLERAIIPIDRISSGLYSWRAPIDETWSDRLRAGQKIVVDYAALSRGGISDGLIKNVSEKSHTLPLMLFDGAGQVFGIGVAAPHCNGGVEILLKRGLS